MEEEKKTGTDPEEKQEEKKVISDPFEQLQKLSRGKLKLIKPIRARSQDVTELNYDFCALTSEEMMKILDEDTTFANLFAISNKQAMALFAATAGAQTENVDATDILQRISAPDGVRAMQIAKLFYDASSRAGGKNTRKG